MSWVRSLRTSEVAGVSGLLVFAAGVCACEAAVAGALVEVFAFSKYASRDPWLLSVLWMLVSFSLNAVKAFATLALSS